MVAAYQAADLYVHPARMENAPCQIQESLACGTPVLAFSVGGIPEMIQSGENGFLSREVTSKSLSDCLSQALADSTNLSQMSEQCRKTAKDLWDAGRLTKMLEDILLGLKGD
jgi:glycosyltransferase involved in cell wall biosynthesis